MDLNNREVSIGDFVKIKVISPINKYGYEGMTLKVVDMGYYNDAHIKAYTLDSLPNFSFLEDDFEVIRSEPVTVPSRDELTQEEIEWLQVGRNLKRLSVGALVEDLELGGYAINCAVSELLKLYTDDEDDEIVT